MRQFIILLGSLMIAGIVSAQADNLLQVDKTRMVTVTPEAAAVLMFEGNIGTAVTINATALTDSFDAVVWLVGLDDRLLAFGAQAPHIDDYPLPADGLYRVYVDSFNGVTAGEVQVELRVRDLSVLSADSPTWNRETLPVRYLVQLDANYAYLLQIPELAGRLTITARDRSGYLDPSLAIRDDDGQIVVRNDDHESTDLSLNVFDARIVDFETSAGAYTIELRDFLGRSGLVELIFSASE